LGGFEHLVRDNGQLGDRLLQPLIRRIAPRLPLPRRRIFDEALPVVDQTSSIEPIVDDAVESQPAAIDRRRIPLAATRTWNLLGVQPGCNSNRRFTAHILPKDALHDLGFGLIDRPPAAIVALAHDVIAVALAARNAPGLHTTDLTSPRLLREVVEIDRCDDALEADMELADLAIGKGDYLDTPVRQALVQTGDVLEIAGETIDGFGQHGVELLLLGGQQQIEQTRPIVQRGPRDRCVTEFGDHLPALPPSVIASRADLVGYRPGVLEVGTESGVDGDAHDGVPSLASSRALSSRAAWRASTHASLRNTSFAALRSSSDDGGGAQNSSTVCSEATEAMALSACTERVR